jgi:hypothetical protein
MIWFFTRGTEEVRIETRYDTATHQFVIDIRRTDRATETERFDTLREFKKRVSTLEKELETERWTQVGGPEILPSNWRGPIH